MRLEDALLYMVVGGDAVSDPGLADMCGRAIDGGVDIVRVDAAPAESAAEIGAVCSRHDAIFIVGEDPAAAASVNARGTHYRSIDGSIGLARAVMEPGTIVGFDANTPDEARLGLELGADYLIYNGGTACPGVFASLGSTGVPLFAGSIGGGADAEQVVAQGVYRLCIDSALVSGEDATGKAAVYSRLLGRCI
jgi:thiamine-phosphate diphosphorylase/hydroxyethylthiazole kinase